MKNIQLTVLGDGIGLAMMDMPGRPFNVFSEDMMADFEELIAYTESNLAGLVISSSKSAFVAGADLGMIKDFADMRFVASKQEMKQRFSHLGKIFRKLELLNVPVVAAINGLALGGGLEVALACHGRICVDVPFAILGLPEIQLGLLPGAGGTQRLPRYIGVENAITLLLTGNPVNPETALEYGLIDKISSKDKLIDDALDMVRTISPGARWDSDNWQINPKDIQTVSEMDWPAKAHKLGGWWGKNPALYPAVDAIIQCISQGLPQDIDKGSEREWDIFVDLMSDPVVANMVVTCFLNKTAAPKIAISQVGKNGRAPEINSLCWKSEQPIPNSLSKKLDTSDCKNVDCKNVDCKNADLVVADLATAIDQDSEKTIYLHQANGGRLEGEDAEKPVITFAGSLLQADACELPNTASSPVEKALSLVLKMGKIPVLVSSAEGVLAPVLEKLGQSLEKNTSQWGKAHCEKALRSVGLEDCAALTGFELTASNDLPVDQHNPEILLPLGLELLTEMSLVAMDSLEQQVINDPEMLDVLLVYALAFPKWTGGAVSFLAMVQRDEIDISALPDFLLQQVKNITSPLKINAGYNPDYRVTQA